jgi:hypothetical protein
LRRKPVLAAMSSEKPGQIADLLLALLPKGECETGSDDRYCETKTDCGAAPAVERVFHMNGLPLKSPRRHIARNVRKAM